MREAIDVMARTMWGEARGDGPEGMRAVGHVIMNRANAGGWWGASVIAVAKKSAKIADGRRVYQFSAWNENDPNRAQMEAVTTADHDFRKALELAEKIHSGELPDNTGGATHYHTKSIYPYWASAGTVTAEIGDHIFYEGVG